MNQSNASGGVGISGPNLSQGLNKNTTLSTQEKDNGSRDGSDIVHMLHDKQYTPDLKTSDFHLINDHRKSVQVTNPYEK